jgi:hypothetical protein
MAGRILLRSFPLLAALLLGLPSTALTVFGQQPSKILYIPFKVVHSLILLEATVNGTLAVLLLDTGANNSLVSPQAAGIPTVKLHTMQSTGGTGSEGQYAKSRIDLRLGSHHWIDREILVMDLSDVSKRAGTKIDGFLGQDILQTFKSVRIDYKAHVIELE